MRVVCRRDSRHREPMRVHRVLVHGAILNEGEDRVCPVRWRHGHEVGQRDFEEVTHLQ